MNTYDKWLELMSDNPANQQELPKMTELEEQQEWNQELKYKIERMRAKIDYLIAYAETVENTYLTNKLKEI